MAGSKECDHLHDGMGFLTGHNAISLEFEKVLRTVDRSVSIPYWDYTIDMHEVKLANKVRIWCATAFFSIELLSPIGHDDLLLRRRVL